MIRSTVRTGRGDERLACTGSAQNADALMNAAHVSKVMVCSYTLNAALLWLRWKGTVLQHPTSLQQHHLHKEPSMQTHVCMLLCSKHAPMRHGITKTLHRYTDGGGTRSSPEQCRCRAACPNGSTIAPGSLCPLRGVEFQRSPACR